MFNWQRHTRDKRIAEPRAVAATNTRDAGCAEILPRRPPRESNFLVTGARGCRRRGTMSPTPSISTQVRHRRPVVLPHVPAAGRHRRHGPAARGRAVRRHALGARGLRQGHHLPEAARRGLHGRLPVILDAKLEGYSEEQVKKILDEKGALEVLNMAAKDLDKYFNPPPPKVKKV